MKRALLLTCEHAAARVPRTLIEPLHGAPLETHRGRDIGALDLARHLARALAPRLAAPLVATRVSRLVVDANRARTNPAVFSQWTRALERDVRDELLARYWAPHRTAVQEVVRRAVRRATLVHVGVHSFTPVLDDHPRAADVALLYDPARASERAFADRWLAALAALRPDLRLRRNYPYRGTSDGLVRDLRRLCDATGRGRRYLGLELEVNQAFPLGSTSAWHTLQQDLAATLGAALDGSSL